ncbi:hypothetical protein FACS1894147_12360 [Spirochaetia bacterium]|nr:hypothetical protein FACS1894147_12360 [Spirochaetia bacterium]
MKAKITSHNIRYVQLGLNSLNIMEKLLTKYYYNGTLHVRLV